MGRAGNRQMEEDFDFSDIERFAIPDALDTSYMLREARKIVGILCDDLEGGAFGIAHMVSRVITDPETREFLQDPQAELARRLAKALLINYHDQRSDIFIKNWVLTTGVEPFVSLYIVYDSGSTRKAHLKADPTTFKTLCGLDLSQVPPWQRWAQRGAFSGKVDSERCAECADHLRTAPPQARAQAPVMQAALEPYDFPVESSKRRKRFEEDLEAFIAEGISTIAKTDYQRTTESAGAVIFLNNRWKEKGDDLGREVAAERLLLLNEDLRFDSLFTPGAFCFGEYEESIKALAAALRASGFQDSDWPTKEQMLEVLRQVPADAPMETMQLKICAHFLARVWPQAIDHYVQPPGDYAGPQVANAFQSVS